MSKHWKNLKEKFESWKETLRDVVKEVKQIQTNLWVGGFVLLITLFIAIICAFPAVPEVVRLLLLPSISLGLVGVYLAIVIAWTTSVIKFKWLASQLELAKREAATLPEIGDVKQKPFDYLIKKIELLLYSVQDKKPVLNTAVTFIGHLNDETINEIQMLADLASKYNLGFECYITEKTTNRFAMNDKLRNLVVALDKVYLTGELPVFDKLIVIPGVIIIGFIRNVWLSWILTDTDVTTDKIKGKIILTPFPKKISQFFGKQEVHSSVSIRLSDIVNREGFMIGAEHLYLWIEDPKKLFENITEYQQVINAKFEEVSDELRPISTHITASLPLLDNYKAIIQDSKIQEWLEELKEEATKRTSETMVNGVTIQRLDVERYIYVQGKLVEAKWEIDQNYLDEVFSFLEMKFFEELSSNYHIWIILCDKKKMTDIYEQYKGSATIEFPFESLVSNWIWFECQDGYHVLQYEKGLRIDEKVAKALAPVLHKDESELTRISAFMFADAVDPNSHEQEIVRTYNEYRQFLKYFRETSLVMTLADFLKKFRSGDQK